MILRLAITVRQMFDCLLAVFVFIDVLANALIGFRDQVELSGAGDRAGAMQMVVVDHQNRHRTVCSSGPVPRIDEIANAICHAQF